MDHRVIGRVKGFASKTISQNSDLAIIFIAHHAAVTVFAGNLAAGPVEGIAIAVAAGMAELTHVTIFLQPTHLYVIGDITP